MKLYKIVVYPLFSSCISIDSSSVSGTWSTCEIEVVSACGDRVFRGVELDTTAADEVGVAGGTGATPALPLDDGCTGVDRAGSERGLSTTNESSRPAKRGLDRADAPSTVSR